MSRTYSFSNRSELRPVTCPMRRRHWRMLATFSRTTSGSTIRPGPREADLNRTPYLLEVEVLVQRADEEAVHRPGVAVQQQPALAQDLHTQDGRCRAEVDQVRLTPQRVRQVGLQQTQLLEGRNKPRGVQQPQVHVAQRGQLAAGRGSAEVDRIHFHAIADELPHALAELASVVFRFRA